VLQRLVDSARELAGARYAALGIPDGAGGFRRFLISGMDDELVAAMGPLPRTHGLLIELLASHAAIAITNARLYECSRELTILSERNRLALELHDVVSRKLFSLILSAEAAATLIDRDTGAARAQVQRLQQLAREALEELRLLILGLRPAELEHDGLGGALRKEVAMLERLHGVEIELRLDGSAVAGPERDGDVLRIAQETIHNALRHSGAGRIAVVLERAPGGLVLMVSDGGSGFDPDDPELRSRHLGLTSIEERAAELGGRLQIRSAPGRGTVVSLEVAGDG
jgi:signal transduction histidine kinase